MVATAGGAFLGVAPLVGVTGAGVWILVFALTRYASVASITAAASLPLWAWLFGYPWPVIAFGGCGRRGRRLPPPREHRDGSGGGRRAGSSCAAARPRYERSQSSSSVCAAGPWLLAPSSARSSPIVPWRSATTSWAWIVSKLTCRERDEVAVVEPGQLVEDALERDAYGVLDEPRLQVRVLDDEQLVRPLEELVDRRAHRALDDLDEPLGVETFRGADEERAAAALVVRRERDELEDPLDVAVVEARVEQAVGGRAAHETLRARAGVDPGRLDADDAPHALARGGGDPDQRDHLLRRRAS